MSSDRSIRSLLLGWLVPPLAFILLAGAATAHLIALDAADTAYDRALHNSALALANQVRITGDTVDLRLPPDAQRVLLTDKYDRNYFQVQGPRGEFIAGHRGLPLPPEGNDQTITFNGQFQGQPIRVAAVYLPADNSTVLVEVAETLNKRNNMAREILLGMLIPEILLAAGALALVWLGVTRGLRPLEQLREEIARRSHQRLSAVPEEEAPKEVRPVVHALNDLLEHLRQAMDFQKRFIANAAHQLRTPLAGLQSQAELALQQPSSPELHYTLEQLHSAAVRASHLTHQLLSLARAEPGSRLKITLRPLNLAEEILTIAEEWVNQSIRKEIDLGFELEDAAVAGDPLLIRELLSNLLDNALRYTPSGTHITIRTFLRNGRPVLQVEDNGPGIPEAEQAKVFERFYRLGESTEEGCGLGLAIVKEIAQAHGAEAELKTPASGRGTLVEIRFPSSRPDQEN